MGGRNMLDRTFTFQGQLDMSEGVGNGKNIEEIILPHIPTAVKVVRANITDDRNGIDYWATLSSGQKKSIDLKARDEDFWKKKGQDDVALETWSVIGKKIGWTRDPNKQTDYIFFFWKDTERWMLVPFLMLYRVFCENYEEWYRVYPKYKQPTNNPDGSHWESECIFIPRRLIWTKIYDVFAGTPAPRQVNIHASLDEGVKRVPKSYNPRVE